MTGIKKYIYTEAKVMQIMKTISDEYGIKLEFCKSKEDADKFGWFYNTVISTSDSIFISYFDMYNALEYKLIKFFHEFARIILMKNIPFHVDGYDWNDTSTMQYEMWVTMQALEFAKQKGIVFSDDAVKWMMNKNFNCANSEENLTCHNHRITDTEYWIMQEVFNDKQV